MIGNKLGTEEFYLVVSYNLLPIYLKTMVK